MTYEKAEKWTKETITEVMKRFNVSEEKAIELIHNALARLDEKGKLEKYKNKEYKK